MKIGVNDAKLRAQMAKLQARLEKRVEKLKREAKNVMEAEVRQTAVSLAAHTFPFASGVNAAKFHIRADVGAVFITASAVYETLRKSNGERVAKGFYAAYKRKDILEALRFVRFNGGTLSSIVSIGETSWSLHQRFRNEKGRVTRGLPLRIVSTEDFEQYVLVVQKRLGKAASGWSAGAAMLGGEGGIPNWKSTRVHGDENGYVLEIEEGNRIRYVLVNNVKYAPRLISPGVIRRICGGAKANVVGRLGARMSNR